MEIFSKDKTTSVPSIILMVLLGISSILSVFLGVSISALRESNALLRQSRRLVVGSKVSGMDIQDLSGVPVTIDYEVSQGQTILYFYSGNCHWCNVNWPAMRTFGEKLSSGYKIYAICIDLELEKCRETAPVDELSGISVLRTVSPEPLIQLDISATPTMIVVSKDQKVDKIWKGVFAGERKSEVQEYFKIELPNLQID